MLDEYRKRFKWKVLVTGKTCWSSTDCHLFADFTGQKNPKRWCIYLFVIN